MKFFNLINALTLLWIWHFETRPHWAYFGGFCAGATVVAFILGS